MSQVCEGENLISFTISQKSVAPAKKKHPEKDSKAFLVGKLRAEIQAERKTDKKSHSKSEKRASEKLTAIIPRAQMVK